jgi:hypothetical protein
MGWRDGLVCCACSVRHIARPWHDFRPYHQWRAMGWTKGSQLFGPKWVPLGERVVKLFEWYPHIQMTGVDLGYHSIEAPRFEKFAPDTFTTFASSNKESPHFSPWLNQVHLRLYTTRQKDVAGWKAGSRASAPPDPNERYIFVHDLICGGTDHVGGALHRVVPIVSK